MKLLLLCCNVLLLGSLASCGHREHLGPGVGRATHLVRHRQQIYPEATEARPAGLDSEEAALIHSGYKKRIGGGQTETRDAPSRVLLIEENKDARAR
jgi:hypothetical protein